MSKLIYKVLDHDLWQEACQSGAFLGASIDIQDGFIHFSDRSQVEETVRLHFHGEDNLLLVAFRVDNFGEELKWEASRGGAEFPHLYAKLATGLAVGTWDLALQPDGTHQFPADY
ncbi:MAG: DUF952 domain-containing protein [Pirellulaceae bacterium]